MLVAGSEVEGNTVVSGNVDTGGLDVAILEVPELDVAVLDVARLEVAGLGGSSLDVAGLDVAGSILDVLLGTSDSLELVVSATFVVTGVLVDTITLVGGTDTGAFDVAKNESSVIVCGHAGKT